MQLRTRVTIVVFSTIVAFYAIVGSVMSRSGQAIALGGQYAQLHIFDEVLGYVIQDYVEEPDLEKVRIGSLRGLAEGLDPYSAYLTPEQMKQYDQAASSGQTGMIVSKVQGYAYVVAVLKGSPASQAGIEEGDFIEYIASVPSRDLSLYDTEQLLNGQPGTSVDIRVLHRGVPRAVKVTRARIVQPAIEARVEEPTLGYVKITGLADGKSAEVKTQLAELVSKGAQKIVLDLRGSANGSLQEGVAVANLFIGSGTVARIIGKGGRETQSFTADPSKVVFRGPLAVLIDRSTAGPAEVIAAAVRDHKRGEIIGERTFGAGSEQKLFALSDGGALLITVARYAPSSGKPFMEEPVNPTVKVERPALTEIVIPAEDDEDPLEDKPEQQVQPPIKPEPPAEDVQLRKAVEILKQTTAVAPVPSKRVAGGIRPPVTKAVRDYLLST